MQAVLSRQWTPEELQNVSRELEAETPEQILEWATEEFFPDITLACSFGGGSGAALLDMLMKINPGVPVFYIDTEFLFPETYALRDEAAKRYGFQPLAFKTNLTPEMQAQHYGETLWTKDPDLCCELRKVRPTAQALGGKRAWIAGLRRDQGDSRKDIPIVSWDTKYDLVKINPLANWTDKQVWAYILGNRVPYNKLQDQGYPSIGCTYCTRAVAPGEDARAGRWPEFDKTECGINVQA